MVDRDRRTRKIEGVRIGRHLGVEFVNITLLGAVEEIRRGN
jgi:hypothetical protein